MEPWCYTTDPSVEWEYCDVAQVNISCPLGKFEGNLNPVGIWLLSYSCLLQYFFGSMTWSSFGAECANSISSTVNMTVNLKDDVPALTIAFYIYPYHNSVGNIVEFGNNDARLKIEQTSGDSNYQSEVTVFYDNHQLTRAHVLQPEEWTFLAVTFDGNKQNIKLWRNGEIASIANTDFQQIQLSPVSKDIKIGGNGLQAHIATVMVYDRVLDESEIKAARDRHVSDYGIFQKVISSQVNGRFLQTAIVRSSLDCSRLCLETHCCDAFTFRKNDKACSLFALMNKSCSLSSAYGPLEIFMIENGVEYYRKLT
ncbi:uncharacterized protein [Antedon mediterranea]|uniref:uncharacterized protein n=1 Tax=Antedon mediterranea TaxID=105859 RepID=UPI003AF805BF